MSADVPSTMLWVPVGTAQVGRCTQAATPCTLLHFVPDADDPAGILSRLTAPLPSGSYLALSHITDDGVHNMDELRRISGRAGIQGVTRSRHQVERMFGEFNLVEPGLVWAPQWHPESPDDLYLDRPEASGVYAGVGRKP